MSRPRLTKRELEAIQATVLARLADEADDDLDTEALDTAADKLAAMIVSRDKAAPK